MKILKDLKNILTEDSNIVLTIGNFDGIHRGHKILINETILNAKNTNTKSALMCFEPHPVHFFKNENQELRLTWENEKQDILENIGLDILYILDFNIISQLSAEEFINDILIDKLIIKKLIIGYDFVFGKNRAGNIDLLKKYQDRFELKIIEEQKDNDILFSSSEIRKKLKNGEIEEVNKLLGHNYFIIGKVITGKKLGRTIGYPTANLEFTKGSLIPCHGVYVVRVLYNNKLYYGVANIGTKPTVSNDLKNLLEVYIFNFNEDIYDKKIKVELLKFIRIEKKFDSIDDLKQAIAQDVIIAKKYEFKN